jgi:uncharacterized membrane protein
MMIVAVYETDEQAQLAIESLGEAGITLDQASVVGVGEHEDQAPAFEGGQSATARGAGRGAVLGGIAGVVLWVIPGGPIVVGGALAAGAIGAAAGGGLGILAEAGASQQSLPDYEEDLTEGRYLVCVHGDAGDVERARLALEMTDTEEIDFYDAV